MRTRKTAVLESFPLGADGRGDARAPSCRALSPTLRIEVGRHARRACEDDSAPDAPSTSAARSSGSRSLVLSSPRPTRCAVRHAAATRRIRSPRPPRHRFARTRCADVDVAAHRPIRLLRPTTCIRSARDRSGASTATPRRSSRRTRARSSRRRWRSTPTPSCSPSSRTTRPQRPTYLYGPLRRRERHLRGTTCRSG